MSEIAGNLSGAGRLPPSYPSAGDAGPGNAGQVSQLSQIDSVGMLADMAKIAAALKTGNSAPTSAAKGADLISNSAGAPTIDGVTLNFSAEDMAAALQMLQGKTQEAQMRTAKEGLEVSKARMKETHEKAMGKIDEWIKNCASAAAKEKSAGIFGWIAKIGAFIAAAIAVVIATVATVASAGAASPLLALSVMALAGATMSLASAISQEAGGPALEISTLMNKVCTSLLVACGVPKDKAEAAGKVMAGAMALIACPGLIVADPALFGNLAGGIAELSGGDATQVAIVGAVFTAVAAIAVTVAMVVCTGGAGAGAAVEGIAKTVQTVAKVTSQVASITSGVATATMGGLNIGKAFDEHDANMAQVDKKMFDALLIKLQKTMEEDQEEIKKLVQQMQDGLSVVSQMINSAGESRQQLSANLGKAMA